MTVGIVSFAVMNEIVAVSDQLATIGSLSADDLVLKSYPIHRNWYCLYAGDDVGHVPFILDRIIRLLSPHKKEKTAQQVSDAVSQAIEETLQSEIRHKILSRYRFDCDSFRDKGKSKLTEAAFNRLASRIEAVELDCRFLVFGFDELGQNRLLCIDEEDAYDYTQPGFWAIGTGGPAAISSLLFAAKHYGFNRVAMLHECIYQTLAAKFMAESVRTVGEKTFLYVIKRNEPTQYFPDDLIEALRLRWQSEGVPRVPPNIGQTIMSIPWKKYGDLKFNDEKPKPKKSK